MRRVVGYIEGRPIWQDEGFGNGAVRASKAIRGELVVPVPVRAPNPNVTIRLAPEDVVAARRRFNRTLTTGEPL